VGGEEGGGLVGGVFYLGLGTFYFYVGRVDIWVGIVGDVCLGYGGGRNSTCGEGMGLLSVAIKKQAYRTIATLKIKTESL